MNSPLTSTEQQYIKQYLNSVDSLNTPAWLEWMYGVTLACGGLVAVTAILATLNHLSTENIRYMLIPGVVTSVVLLMFGSSGLILSKRRKEKIILGRVLKKLLGNDG